MRENFKKQKREFFNIQGSLEGVASVMGKSKDISSLDFINWMNFGFQMKVKLLKDTV